MGLPAQIIGTWFRPDDIIRQKQAAGVTEAQVLGYILLAGLLSFIGRLPEILATELPPPDIGATESPIAAYTAAQFVAVMIFGTLFFYALAAISRLIAKRLGGKGNWLSSRLALFWVMFALQPIGIAFALLNPLIVSDTLKIVTSTAVMIFFVWAWLKALHALETHPNDEMPTVLQ